MNVDHTLKIRIESDEIKLIEFGYEFVSEEYINWLNDPEVNKYLESRHFNQTLTTVINYVKKSLASKDEIMFAILYKNKHVGNIKISNIDRFNKTGILSLIIGDKLCWGSGVGRKSIQLLTNYCFDSLNLLRIEAGCISSNLGSYKAFIASGYVHESTKFKSRIFDNTILDTYVMVKINEKFTIPDIL